MVTLKDPRERTSDLRAIRTDKWERPVYERTQRMMYGCVRYISDEIINIFFALTNQPRVAIPFSVTVFS